MNIALLVGINSYPGNELRGCLNDVASMRELLTANGFSPMHIKVLKDFSATKDNILADLARMIERAHEGDHLVFHFSGHGSQTPDTSGDESDGMDEILCPYGFDRQHGNYISDDEIRQVLSGLNRGATLDIILDCCHSGTGTRDPDDIVARFIPPPFPIPTDGRWPRAILKDLCQPGVALWAGCRSNQTSADAYIDGKYQGAFTWAFCKAITKSGYAWRVPLHDRIKQILELNGYDQIPQLEASDEMKNREVFT